MQSLLYSIVSFIYNLCAVILIILATGHLCACARARLLKQKPPILNSGSATATVDRDEEDNAISRRANLTTAAFQSELRYK